MTAIVLPADQQGMPRPVSAADDARGSGRFLLTAVLALGVFFPTSLSGEISAPLLAVHQLVFCAIVFGLSLRRQVFGSTLQLWNACFIVVWCLGVSVISPFRDLAIGAAGVYVTMAALLSVDVSRLEIPPVTRFLRLVTVIVLATAAGVMTGNEWVVRFLTANFSFAYAELLPTMLVLRKPVFTFGSHSLAGFFYFLFFYLNLETYRAYRRRADLALAVGCILAGALLASITSAVLMTAALLLLFVGIGRARWPLFTALALALALTAWRYRGDIGSFVAVSNMLTSLEFEGGGLSGRFGRSGNLLSNLELIRSQPLRPIGFSFSSTVFYGDSGPIEYVLRGSLPLLLSVYGGFALFLWRNLRLRRDALVLFAVTVAFEVGMSVLTYHRFVYVALFAVLYLNSLASNAPGVRIAASGEPTVPRMPA